MAEFERSERAGEGLRGRKPVLQSFNADWVAGLGGPEWLARRRSDAFDEFLAMPLPSEKEEVWRYTPIDQLDLSMYRPAGAGPGALTAPARDLVESVRQDIGRYAALVTVVDGRIMSIERSPGLEATVTTLTEPTGASLGPALLGSLIDGGDALVRLNDACHPDAVVVDIPAGREVRDPVVVVHWCGSESSESSKSSQSSPGATASFPRTVVRVGANASASVVEVTGGAPDAGPGLVVPVVELRAEEGARLSYVSLQILGQEVWQIGRLAGEACRDASLRAFTVGLGGAYARMRTDAVATGTGATTALHSAYLGTGSQVHDIRTKQDHAAPHTTSDLLCKGAVAGVSRSVYSGLIRVRHGAVRTEAMQTNRNLVLSEHAHADSVPNLDIEENDVRCSHASTVGPVDEDQLYYLESRGIPPEAAKRLIVLGFFDAIVAGAPEPAVRPRLRTEIGARLVAAFHSGEEVAADHG